jgi:formate dehydrogenase iron-sulfur subunit
MKSAILTDLTRCIGCEACVLACREINELPKETPGNQLSDISWTAVERRHSVNVRRHCMHCEEPACASACPVGALVKTPEGAVTYDADKCMGCRYCMVACPFGMPKYEWEKPIPRVQKCIMCYEKALRRGRQPACTATCPSAATIFGEREALIREAQKRITEQPNRYISQIYGLKEAGGTCVLYLSAVPFSELGFPAQVRQDPYPRLTWNVLSKIPNVVATGGALLFGAWWIINRRIKLADEKESHPDRALDE